MPQELDTRLLSELAAQADELVEQIKRFATAATPWLPASDPSFGPAMVAAQQLGDLAGKIKEALLVTTDVAQPVAMSRADEFWRPPTDKPAPADAKLGDKLKFWTGK